MRLPKWVCVTIVIVGSAVALTEGASWKYHFASNYVAPGQPGPCPGGDLKVYGTINCVPQEPPLFQGYAVRCHEYQGSIPEWANDVRYIFDWDYVCHNHDDYKQAVPVRPDPDGPWYLEPLELWINSHLVDWTILPTLGDPTGQYQNIYVVVDIATWLANPRPIQSWYDVANGVNNEELPGYFVSSTPITFDPYGVDHPWVGTPFTGMLEHDGEVSLIPEPSAIGLVLLAGVLVRRQR